ncbi:DUF4031 domain-containing protein [Ammonicoccus fulvus]|uniref:DUF4031 domain-containing protein n=1 Tax=Ammonicoccus fulvus TaxID=3138240 RepID=A0ABZ3FQL7_9ACTN
MTVWIDTPAWPHRGQMFAHMVSDTSLEELHVVAERAGVHPRGFDRDHYDVPERLHGACLDAGAVPAHTRRLVRALRESGLRLTKAQLRADREARRSRLLARWPLPQSAALAEELLDRWSERGRRYHDPRHLEHCLVALDVVGTSEDVVRLAAWFHDAIYEGRGGGADEEASAQLAEERLAGVLSPTDVAEVARLIRLTAGHETVRGDRRGNQLCDADLAILGETPDRYARYCRDIRVEYAEVPLPDFRRGRLQVVQLLLYREHLYRTDIGLTLWARNARENLAQEAARLSRPLP